MDLKSANGFCHKMLQLLWKILTRIRSESEVARLGISLIRVTQDAKQPTLITKAMDIISPDLGRPKPLVNKVAAIIQKRNVADLDIDVWNIAIGLYLMGSFYG